MRKKYLTLLFLTLLSSAACFSLLFYGCGTHSTEPEKTTFSGSIIGIITDVDNTNYIESTTVSLGNNSTTSEASGMFILQNAPSGDRIQVNFNNINYIPLQKVLHLFNNKSSFLQVSLAKPSVTSILNSQPSGVSIENNNVDIPDHSFYNGGQQISSVHIKGAYLNPLKETFLNSFPGDFTAMRTDNSIVQFESYGALYIQASYGSVNYTLASGKLLSVSIIIPNDLVANAPNTITSWYYDETSGYWKEMGIATRHGSNYQYVVNKLGYTCIGIPISGNNISYLNGRVLDNSSNPVVGAMVVATGNNYHGSTYAITQAGGTFTLNVKPASIINLVATFGFTNSEIPKIISSTPVPGSTDLIPDVTLLSPAALVYGKTVDGSGNIKSSVKYCFQNGTPDSLITPSNGRFYIMGKASSSATSKFYYDLKSKDINLQFPAEGYISNVGDIKLD
jgi:hypothetical protein